VVFIGTVDERELSLMIRKLKIYMLFITQPMQAIYIYIYIYNMIATINRYYVVVRHKLVFLHNESGYYENTRSNKTVFIVKISVRFVACFDLQGYLQKKVIKTVKAPTTLILYFVPPCTSKMLRTVFIAGIFFMVKIVASCLILEL
jgi:hypothetical protein